MDKLSKLLGKAEEGALWTLLGEVSEKIVTLMESGTAANDNAVKFWHILYTLIRTEIDSRLAAAE